MKLKRIFLSLFVAIVALVALGFVLDVQAAAPAASPAPAPVHDLPAPTQQTTETFSVSCGDVSVTGPCEADCLTLLPSPVTQDHYQTILYAWPISATGHTTLTEVVTKVYPTLYADHDGDAPCPAAVNNFDHSVEWSEVGCEDAGWWKRTAARGRVNGLSEDIPAPCAVMYSVGSDETIKAAEAGGPYDAFESASGGEDPGYLVCIQGDYYDTHPCYPSRCEVLCASYGGCDRTRGTLRRTYWQCDTVGGDTHCYWDLAWAFEREGNARVQSIKYFMVSEITVTEPSTGVVGGIPCVIEQEIVFDTDTPVVGKEVDSQDFPPLGLDPFENGIYRSFVPISSTILTYEMGQCSSGEQPGEGESGDDEVFCTYPDLESHTIAWQTITFTPPFSVPNCLAPTLAITSCPTVMENTPSPPSECSSPGSYFDVIQWMVWIWCNLRTWYGYFVQWWIYLWTFWFTWLWCRLQAWLAYLVGWVSYSSCMGQAAIYTAANGVIEYIYNIYIDVAEYFEAELYVIVDFFKQLGLFVESVLVPEGAAWLGDMIDCVSNYAQVYLVSYRDYLSESVLRYFSWLADFTGWAENVLGNWLPGTVDFVVMATTEVAVWLSDFFSWLASDFLEITWHALMDLLVMVIEQSDTLMRFVVQQFVSSILDAVNMLGYIIDMIVFVIDLLAALIEGFEVALNSETEATLFSSLNHFWRGIEFFEDAVSDTPLVFLNMVAIGLIGINLTLWTIGQVSGLVDDLMQI